MSQCKLSCPDGYTSNGDPNKVCVPCNPMCATCRDDGNVGDKDLCMSCAPEFPKFYAPGNICMKECSNGFYDVNADSCDKCALPCENCVGDKYNCISCDHTELSR